MKNFPKWFFSTILTTSMFLISGYFCLVIASDTCVWEGKAPICSGKCSPGFTLVERDKKGDGKKCTTGTKARCCLTTKIIIRGNAPFCNGKCKVGEERLEHPEYGPKGKKCTTGSAAICGLTVN
jgi:hypothetical protein